MSQDSTSKRSLPFSLLIGIGCVGLVLLCQAFAPSFSYQWANMLSFLMGLIGAISLFLWWFRYVAPNKAIALAPLAIAAVVFAWFISQYELHGVSGELIPEFRRRAAADMELPSAATDPVLTDADSLSQSIMLSDQAHPGFMGSNRDGRIEQRMFATDWSDRAPELVWSQPVGSGLAGVAVVQRITDTDGVDDAAQTDGASRPTWLGYTLEQRGEDECVLCYDLSDGSVVWEYHSPGYHSHFLGDEGPRTTPTIDSAGRLFAQGATGRLWCLDAITGELLWDQDLVELADSTQLISEELILWGRAGSPLRVDDKVIVPFGGSPRNSSQEPKSLIAFQADTGDIAWQSEPGQISYASPVLATLAGVRQIVTVDQNFARGWSIETGEKLWEVDWPGVTNANANCSNPVILPGDRVLLTKEYGGGAKLVHVTKAGQGDQWSVQTEWSDPSLLKTKFTNAVIDGDYAYGISNGMLECVQWEEGERQWRQPRRGRFGHGHIVLVEDVIVSSTDEGAVVVVSATPDSYQELGRFQAIEGKTWNPPTVFSNYVLIRNGVTMALWKLKPKN